MSCFPTEPHFKTNDKCQSAVVFCSLNIPTSIFVALCTRKKPQKIYKSHTAEYTDRFYFLKIYFFITHSCFTPYQAVMSTSIRDCASSDFWKAVAAVTLKSSSRPQRCCVLSAMILVSNSGFKRLFSPQSSHNLLYRGCLRDLTCHLEDFFLIMLE